MFFLSLLSPPHGLEKSSPPSCVWFLQRPTSCFPYSQGHHGIQHLCIWCSLQLSWLLPFCFFFPLTSFLSCVSLVKEKWLKLKGGSSHWNVFSDNCLKKKKKNLTCLGQSNTWDEAHAGMKLD